MKKQSKKVIAFMVTVVMLFAMTATAFAGTTLDANGEQGAFASKDTPVSQAKTLVLEKELTVYNQDENNIQAPTISYTYSIAPATVASGTVVTDAAA